MPKSRRTYADSRGRACSEPPTISEALSALCDMAEDELARREETAEEHVPPGGGHGADAVSLLSDLIATCDEAIDRAFPRSVTWRGKAPGAFPCRPGSHLTPGEAVRTVLALAATRHDHDARSRWRGHPVFEEEHAGRGVSIDLVCDLLDAYGDTLDRRMIAMLDGVE